MAADPTFDEPTGIVISAWNDRERGLRFDRTGVQSWIESTFHPRRSRQVLASQDGLPGYGFVIEPDGPPPVYEIDGWIPATSNIVILETATPRFAVRFVQAFDARFPGNQQFYAVVFGLLYGYIDLTLPEDEALAAMMSGNGELMTRLGVGTVYDWGQ